MEQHWMRLDNAALVFPAIRSRRWSNVFRVSALLREDVDPAVLQQAAEQIIPRFPSFFVRLRRGLFWHYLESIPQPPRVREDWAYPLAYMGKRETPRCCLRILYYKNRIAVEFFHSLTDGTGGMIFLKTLTACYLSLRHGLTIPAEHGVLDWTKPPAPEELEDSFLRHKGPRVLNDREQDAYRLTGTPEPGFLYLTTGLLSSRALLEAAHSQNATVTVFLAAVMAQVILELQSARKPARKQKPVKITIPVNLRRLYGSRTLRNFVLTLNPGVDPRLGEYTLGELCQQIAAQLKAEATPQKMAGRIAANVEPQENPILKLAPLGVKTLAMRLVYSRRGESKGCINVSNLGQQRLPAPMADYVQRLSFVVGPQRSYPNNCSVASFGDTVCISMIRRIRESELEQRFFSRLVELGLKVEIESNDPAIAKKTE